MTSGSFGRHVANTARSGCRDRQKSLNLRQCLAPAIVEGDVTATLNDEQFAPRNLPVQRLAPRKRRQHVLFAPYKQHWHADGVELAINKILAAAPVLEKTVNDELLSVYPSHDIANDEGRHRLGAHRLPKTLFILRERQLGLVAIEQDTGGIRYHEAAHTLRPQPSNVQGDEPSD